MAGRLVPLQGGGTSWRATDGHFRLWFTDNALHGDDELQESPRHTVSYLGVLQQALRDVSRWVEEDVAPPASTDL